MKGTTITSSEGKFKKLRSTPWAPFPLSIALGLLCLNSASKAQRQPGAPKTQGNFSKLQQDGERELEDGRSTLDESTLKAAEGTFEDCVHRDGKNARCFYDLGRTESYLVQVRELQKDRNGAEHWLDSAIENTQRSIAIEESLADAHALLASLYGIKIGYGGAFAGMRYGPKSEAEAQRALQLDPNCAGAYVVLGRRYLYAPKMFGGDVNKAIDSFRKSTTVDPRYDEGFVWLAIACRKKGDASQAQKALANALRLNGRSAFAKRILSGAD
jgi:tetratricopeptide (TPR) repeat protein